jgi:hypothetical protein
MKRKSNMTLIGSVFNRLTVIDSAERRNGKTAWLCRCECGTEKVVQQNNLVSGTTKSCGCYKSQFLSAPLIVHGHKIDGKKSPTYISYDCMIGRCRTQSANSYIGIDVCEHWKNSFEQFLLDMGPRPEGKTIDRKDNTKGYLCPKCGDNCRWATKEEQTLNRRPWGTVKEQVLELELTPCYN